MRLASSSGAITNGVLTITGSDSNLSVTANGVTVTDLATVVPVSGSAAGTVVSSKTNGSLQKGYVSEGDPIVVTSDGASSTACAANIYVVLARN
jgi:hypothetical protein